MYLMVLGYNFVLVNPSYAEQWECFGKGQTRIELFKKGLDHYGYEYQVECVIEGVDEWSRVVTIRKEDSIMFVRFEHIYSMDKYDYML